MFVDKKTLEIMPDDLATPENSIGAENADELVKVCDKEQILKIHANVFKGSSVSAAKKSDKVLAKEIFEELDRDEPRDEPEADQPKEDKPKEDKPKPKKMDIIRATVKEKGSVSRKDLAALVGSTENNVHTMISIMGNPKRTKDAVKLPYDKETKTYTWPS